MTKPRDSVKNKAIITFLLAIVAILAAGIFGWFSLRQILTRVDRLSQPDKTSILINSVFADLLELEQSGRQIVATNSDSTIAGYHQTVARLKTRLDSLKHNISPSMISIETLDSVNLLLGQLEVGYEQLMAAQKNYSLSTLSIRLMEEISKELHDSTRTVTDSSYVIRNNTSFINISEFTRRTLDSLHRLEIDPERVSVFKKLKNLFSRKDGGLSDTIYVVPDKQVDSLLISSVDSVKVTREGDYRAELEQLVGDFYNRERTSLERLARLESDISRKNAMLMETIESFIIAVDREEIKRTRQSASEAYQASVGFRKALLAIIGFFVTTGLIMLSLLMKDLRRSRYYEQQILLEKEKAENAVKVKQQFVATMSHEIRSPLTSIIGYSELIGDSSEYGRAIKSSSEHLLQTANEILDIARLESGIIEIYPSPVQLDYFFRNLVLAFKEAGRKKSVAFEYDFSQLTGTWVKTDPHRLNQVLYNLLDNAFKFTEQGVVALNASVTPKNSDGNSVTLHVHVKDSGIGIRAEDQGKIFDDYQQSGGASYSQKGVGLGLSIVKKLVSMLNGSITLESAPGEGSTFSLAFDFPVTYEIKAEAADGSLTDTLSGTRILVVDDDPLIVNLFKTVLRKHGADVQGAHSAFETLAINEQRPFDVFIIDLQMPDMDGEELTKSIRETHGDSVKILLATANLFLEKDSLRIFDGVLIKPCSEGRLLRAIWEATGTHPGSEVPEKKANGTEHNGNTYAGKGYDMELIKRFAMNDPDGIRELAGQFHLETTADLGRIKEELALGEIKKLASVMHKLASRFGQFGIHTLSAAAGEIEKEAFVGRISKYRLASFIAQSEIVNEQIRADFGL